jgi:sec-independent protein translocase protein TatC
MRQHPDTSADPEDLFADTRMSFGEHIEDLRVHLIRAGLGFLLGMVAALFIAKPVLEIIAAPVKRELFNFQRRNYHQRKNELEERIREARRLPPVRFKQRVNADPLIAYVRDQLNLPKDKQQEPPAAAPLVALAEDLLHELQVDHLLERGPGKASNWIELDVEIGDLESYLRELQRLKPYIDLSTLKTFTVMETFIVYFKVALLTGLVITSPWVFWQIWSFIAAGLYPHEKRLVNYYLPISLSLFLAGVILCQIFVIPKAIEALLWFNEWLGFEPELRLSDWLGFAIMMPLLFGVCFQTPLVMMFLNRVGIMDVEVFRSKRRIAWFIMAVFAAVITPTVDAISMLFLWVPMGVLYELGILLCEWQQRHAAQEMEESTSDEMVEV